MKNERLEQRAAFVALHRIAQSTLERADDARIEEVELGMRHLLDPGPGLPGREPDADQRVGEHIEVALHRHAGHAGIARDVAVVEHLAVHEAGDLQEAREGIQVPDERLLLDLLAKVRERIGLDRRNGPARMRPDVRQKPEGERAGALEVLSQLRDRQREELAPDDTAREQVRARAAQLARARSAQGEAVLVAELEEERVHLVEQRGELLDLVDDDPASPGKRGDLHAKPVGIAHEAEQRARAEEVVPGGAREALPEPRRLARAPRPQAEERAVGRHEAACIHGGQFYRKFAHVVYNNIGEENRIPHCRRPRAPLYAGPAGGYA